MNRRGVTAFLRLLALWVALAGTAGSALAHGGSLGGAARDSLTVPTWLVAGTGGAAVGASFLLASFATDRAFVAAIHEPYRRWSLPDLRTVERAVAALSVLALAGVLVTGFFGPRDALSNPAVVVVWVGWWAGYTMSTYVAGNTWPAVNPWRAVAAALPALGRDYAWRWGAWPSVAALLGLFWLEVVSPLADRPPALATAVLAYTAVTVTGAVVYGVDQWFGTVDPVSRVFRFFGYVAPVARTDDGLSLRLPGAGLTADVLSGPDEVAFVVALLWGTTFDGLVTTPLWETTALGLADAGVPLDVVYPAALLLGFALFWGVYLFAARLARRTAPTYVDAAVLARRFAPSLLAIAAGYHLAHFFGYFVSLSPTLPAAVLAPMAVVDPPLLGLPGWFGGVAVVGVLGGHVLAVLAAHTTAFDVFPGRLQAVRSQYPFTAVMVWYTMVSLWVVTRPEVVPP